MDALWFWFAKFLVELGIVFGLAILLLVVSFIMEMRK